jgi:hypothetical protein
MSTVFLSFGPKSGFLTGHAINSMIECQDSPALWYSESYTGLLPNVVFFDNAKTVKLYEDYDIAMENDAGKASKIQKIDLPKDGPIQIPKFKPTPFIDYIKKGGVTSLPLDKPRPDFGLENCEIGWCDIVNFNLSRRSFCEIPGTDTEPMNTYQAGFEKASELDHFDEYTDPIRRQFESCDRMGAVVFAIDRNNGFGGFASKLSEYVIEEAPKAVRFVFSTCEAVESDEIAANASLATASFLEFAHIHTLLVPPPEEALPNIIDAKKYKADNDFSRMGLLSMPFVSSLIPLLNGNVTPRKYLDTIAPSSILKFAALNTCFPSFDDHSLFTFPAEERVFTRFVTTAGVGDKAPEAIEALKPEAPFFFDHASSAQPLFVGINQPHIFKDGYVTMEGMKPTEKPPALSDADYKRLVAAGVIRPKLGVDCANIRALSSVSYFSTSRSLSTQLEYCVNFIRNAHAISHDISDADALQKAEVVLNIIDGLRADE